MSETFLDLDQTVQFLDEARKFEPKHDDKVQKLIRLLKSKALADQKISDFHRVRRYGPLPQASPGRGRYRGGRAGGQCHEEEPCRGHPGFAPYYNGLSSPELAEFLDHVEANVPPDLDIHIVMDNDSTHKTKTIRDSFAGVRAGMFIAPRRSASWLSQGRTLLRRSDGEADPVRCSPIDRRVGTGNRRVHRDRQRGPQAVPMAQVRRRHPGFHQALLPQDHRNRYGRRFITVRI